MDYYLKDSYAIDHILMTPDLINLDTLKFEKKPESPYAVFDSNSKM